MNYINTETGEDDLTEFQVRTKPEFDSIAFCAADFPPAPYAQRLDTAQPSFDPLTQDVTRAPSAFIDGAWRQVWSVVDVSVEEAATRLATAKAQAWTAIKAERDRRQSDGGVNVGGKWFLSSDKEAGRYNLVITAAAAAGVPGTYVMRAAWRTMEDGVTQDMTANLARQIILTGLAQFAAIDDAAQAHRAAMEQSSDPLAYDFSGNWPAIYGE